MHLIISIFRKQSPSVLYKNSVFKNFTKFTGKHLSWSLFLNKVGVLRTPIMLKKRLRHRCFPVNFAKYLWTSTLWSICHWLLLDFCIDFERTITYHKIFFWENQTILKFRDSPHQYGIIHLVGSQNFPKKTNISYPMIRTGFSEWTY